MAFSTIQGSGGAPDSFVGTSGVDSISIINSTGNFFLGAQEANDVATLITAGVTDPGVITGATLKGGQGNDTFISGVNVLNGVFINGNSDADTLTINSLFSASTVQGGQGVDNIALNGGVVSALVNGNRDNDTIGLNSSASNSFIFGGQANDTINIASAAAGVASAVNVTATEISGDDGNDSIIVDAAANGNVSVAGSTLNGGAGNDTITATNAASSVLANGEDGNDQLLGSANADTLDGGAGNDQITGNAQADQMRGGAGSDNFIYAIGAPGEADTIDNGIIANNSVIDTIFDFSTTTDVISGFGLAGAGVFATTGGATGDATFAAARATADGIMAAGAGDEYVVAAYGSGSSWTAVLFTDVTDTGNAVGAIQIGAAGAFGTEAAAMNAIVAADILA